MSSQTSSVSKIEQTHPVSLCSFNSDKFFEDVVSDFESQLGRFDEAKAISSGNKLQATMQQMTGTSGLMIIGMLQMGRILPSLASASIHARQYLIGNPLIASKMAEHNTLAALYAPPRVLIYTAEGKTWISYDKPSTTFGRLSSTEIEETARDLDVKFETLVTNALT